jgi:ribonuclease P protein component
MIAYLRVDDGVVPPRVGFVVSRAVGGAVVRNAVTRRLRALGRDRLPALPEGSLLVLRALPPSATASYAELGEDLDGCLERLLAGARGLTAAGRPPAGAGVST